MRRFEHAALGDQIHVEVNKLDHVPTMGDTALSDDKPVSETEAR